MTLDPTVAAMLEQMAAADAPTLAEMGPGPAREMYRAMQGALPEVDLHTVSDLTIPVAGGSIGARHYRPSDASGLPCLVYYHGGGWVIGDLETHDSVCRQIAIAADCAVIAVDYRLAPEHPFPVPVDDSYAALKWIVAQADALSIDAGRVAVGGDSAGGNLSAAMALKARDDGGPALAHQLLIYPVTDTAMNTGSYADNGEGYMLTRTTMTWFWDCYLGDDAQARRHPLAAPLLAADLSGLPPARVLTAQYDPLRDEGIAYAAALRAAGVAVEDKCFDGMIHGFFGQTNLLEGSTDAMNFAVAGLRDAFGTT